MKSISEIPKNKKFLNFPSLHPISSFLNSPLLIIHCYLFYNCVEVVISCFVFLLYSLKSFKIVFQQFRLICISNHTSQAKFFYLFFSNYTLHCMRIRFGTRVINCVCVCLYPYLLKPRIIVSIDFGPEKI